mgnify:CR=1 FL=1
MLLEKLQEHKNFTAHEKDVAEYILSHLDQISDCLLYTSDAADE